MERKISRGDMFYTDLSIGVGSEQSGIRPALVMSNNIGNKYSGTVIVAVMTSKTKTKIPTHCNIKAQQGLGHDSVVMLEQLQTIDKSRLREYIGTLDCETLCRVNRSLAVSVGFKNGEHI